MKKIIGVHVASVPVTIGFAWLMVITTSLALISPQGEKRHAAYPVLASLLAVAMDLVVGEQSKMVSLSSTRIQLIAETDIGAIQRRQYIFLVFVIIISI